MVVVWFVNVWMNWMFVNFVYIFLLHNSSILTFYSAIFFIIFSVCSVSSVQLLYGQSVNSGSSLSLSLLLLLSSSWTKNDDDDDGNQIQEWHTKKHFWSFAHTHTRTWWWCLCVCLCFVFSFELFQNKKVFVNYSGFVV